MSQLTDTGAQIKEERGLRGPIVSPEIENGQPERTAAGLSAVTVAVLVGVLVVAVLPFFLVALVAALPIALLVVMGVFFWGLSPRGPWSGRW